MEGPVMSAEVFARIPFDFLIVGGGTAGLVIASRLSEHPNLRVGILEAGSLATGDKMVDCPGLAGRALDTHLDWQFRTVPQAQLGGRTIPWARGKALGGSSVLNYMTWNRAARQDYDDWRDLGNPGWGWDDLQPFFKRSETFHKPSEVAQKETRTAHHEGVMGREGPIQVSYPNEYTASHKLWHRTMNLVGVESNDSHLAGSNIGCWTSVVSVEPETATRSYAAVAYYRPSASRPNLFVLNAAEVYEILISREGEPGFWKAEGVRFSHGEAQFSAFASREVIVSAGSVQSPQLLELSGIGNKDILSAAGIPVKVDNPNVGENLQDHLTTTLVFEVDPSLPNPDDLRVDSVLAAASQEYARERTGPLTILPVSISYVPVARLMTIETLNSILSSFPTRADAKDDINADRDALLERRFATRSNSLGHVEYIFELGNWGVGRHLDRSETKKYGSLLQILQYPFSKGSIHVKSEDPSRDLRANLAIDPQYFGGVNGRLDLEIAMHAHRFAERICSTQPLAAILREQVWPIAGDTKCDDDLRAWLKKVVTTDWHPVGTCAMGGKAGAGGGVVDERLRVYGVHGLRVADASVMPMQISAHLQATVYAIAEKAAAMILEDHRI